MTEGKLVRDLIPDIIRQSGRKAEIRYLTGEELVEALAAKLREEADEAAQAVGNREHLVEELADLQEVVAAIMTLQGIAEAEVQRVATAKVAKRGAFASGAWLIS